MRIHLPLAAAAAAALLAAACTGGKETAQTPLPAQDTELRQLDTMVITAEAEPTDPDDYELPAYRASQSRPHDLKHTRLRVSFDWDNERVLGRATLRLAPTFRPQDSVTLDAKNFVFNEVRLGGEGGQELAYRYDGREIAIALPTPYERGRDFEVYLDYVATPEAEGASRAISSDKGLFFIDPRDEDPDKPSQIWTQGETEHNSRWMPTVDQPNERATQEFFITVDDEYQTLSNGVLVSSTPAANGQRTDYWRMDLPHAPYLHMIAVGEFAVVEDAWEDVPLSYYVEEEYREDAREIFAHTPEMMGFFSELLGTRYPWPKYAQVVVRDYVSGAMENTTAVVFGEQVQRHARELEAVDNDYIVAHEMFHHWFGDLVTCESWSNLTLNEGFANYSEYLWFEHHDGLDRAEGHRLDELEGYLDSGELGGWHPLVWYQWASDTDLFDAHSYNKGGLVLHMLRDYLGDEAFFAALKRYLADNEFDAVEVDELRMAFEDTVGEDLQWFFDQWFLGVGHPELDVDYGYADGVATVTVEQTQDPDAFRPIFVLPTQIGVYPADGGAPRMIDVTVDRRRQRFAVDAGPDDLVVFDPRSVLLAVRDEERSVADQVKILERVPELRKRLYAARAVTGAAQAGTFAPDSALVERLLADDYLRVRNNGVGLLDPADDADAARLATIAREDADANVRGNALATLAATDRPELAALYAEVLDDERDYGVLASGLQGLFKVDPGAALEQAEKLRDDAPDQLLGGIAQVFASTGDAKYLPFFEERLGDVDGESTYAFAGSYLGLAAQTGRLKEAVERVGGLARDQSSSPWLRFGYMRNLAELQRLIASPRGAALTGGDETVADLVGAQVDAIKAAETNPQLRDIFAQM